MITRQIPTKASDEKVTQFVKLSLLFYFVIKTIQNKRTSKCTMSSRHDRCEHISILSIETLISSPTFARSGVIYLNQNHINIQTL